MPFRRTGGGRPFNQFISTVTWTKHQRKWYGKWHTYFGIIAGLIVSVVGITGSILVFRHEIDKKLYPELYRVSQTGPYLEYPDIIPLIQSRYPGLEVRSIRKAEEKNEGPYVISNRQKEMFFDPRTGIQLGERHAEKNFIAIVLKLHRFLLIPYAGRYIVGASTFGLLILVITGIRLWLPAKWREVRRRLSVNFNGGLKRQSYDWHNVIGVVTSPVVTTLALTGLCMTLNFTSMTFVFLLEGRPPAELLGIIMPKSRPPVSPSSTPSVTLTRLMDSTRAALGRDVVVTRLNLPGRDSADTYRMQATIPGGRPHDGRKVIFALDRYSGSVLANTETSLPVSGHIYFTWLQAMHYGTIGGMPTRILTFIGGLIPFFMFITGCIIWWPRYRKNGADKSQRYVKIREEQAGGFIPSFRKGVRYAGLFVILLMVMSLVYGLLTGFPFQVMISNAVLAEYVILSNFVFALVYLLVYVLLLLPFRRFRRNSTGIRRYLGYSAAFTLVFTIAYLVLMSVSYQVFQDIPRPS